MHFLEQYRFDKMIRILVSQRGKFYMEWNETVENLRKNYDNIFLSKGDTPEWAVHKRNDRTKLIHCSIPFVGKEYCKQNNKILVYASAENLTGYHQCVDWDLDDDEIASNRHRVWFENSLQSESLFFPNIHIAPINDGSLILTAYYIYSKIVAEDIALKPTEFIEKITIGNYCKYSIESLKNTDYVKDRSKLKVSREYISEDLRLLKPKYLIMPKSIYETERSFIDGIKGDAKIIPIYQINASTINRIIAKKYSKYDAYKLSTSLIEWYNQLGKNGITGKTKDNYLAVFSYIDDYFSKTF